MVEYAGWDLPLHYKLSVAEEHNAVRTAAGAFDLSQMGDLLIGGEGAFKAVQKIFTNDFSNCRIGDVKYTHILNENGKSIDDALLTKVADGEYLCVISPATTQKVKDWLVANSNGATIEDHTGEVTCIAVQGPKSPEIVAKIFGDKVLALKQFKADYFPIPSGWHILKDERGVHPSAFHKRLQEEMLALISRTGYTGEDGFEIILPIRAGIQLFRAILVPENGCVPVGIGARDTLRMEMGFLQSAHDIREDRSPLEAGHEWAVNWKHDFIGKAALEAQRKSGGYSHFVGIVMEEHGTPKGGYRVLSDSGEELGKLTSGAISPTLNKGIGLGFFDPAKAPGGAHVMVEIKDKKVGGKVVQPPFVQRPASSLSP